ncbi:hypothetical protein MJT46_012525 [Ovis ammon polii x Ovis aries]|uniref:PITH domain-containing protein n=1 Tax=Ovis aries TaxID=9940 RepID=A0A835ZQV0_SHEEP|nr:hypothetical protein JEQ12_007936 [Ovis aries]KAI4560287.1 hypothetical protein MJT46_012525 [Ovis ammon polii x Ovis aries]
MVGSGSGSSRAKVTYGRWRHHVALPQTRQGRMPLHCQMGGATKWEERPEQHSLAYSPYLLIDLERLQCLNESCKGSGLLALKPQEEQTDGSKFVEKDADEQLLFNIPFTGNVKLKGIIIMGEDDDSHPSEMRLFKNIPQMSFDDTDRELDQTFSLNPDLTGN